MVKYKARPNNIKICLGGKKMHRQIFTFFLLLILILSGCSQGKNLEKQTKPTVSVVIAKEENILIEQVYEAVLQMSDEQVISAEVAGYLRQTFHKVGEQVPSGAKIALLENNALYLATERSRQEIGLSEIQLEKSKVQSEEAKRELERNRTLYQNDALSKVELEKSESKWNLFLQNLDEAQKRLDLARINQKESQLNESDCLITAPCDLWLAESLVQVGEYVNTGQALFRGGKIESLILQIDILPTEAADWQIGDQLEVECKEIIKKATITNINQLSHLGSEYVTVELSLDNSQYDWHPGTIVQLKYTKEMEKQILIPVEAISSGKEPYVYVVKDNKISRQPISLGESMGSKISVSGLKDGTILVSGGLHRLRDGEEVEIKEGF